MTELIIGWLAGHPPTRVVGEAMRFYYEHGVVFSDLHDQNIGWSEPGPGPRRHAVITDPGHIVALDEYWLKTPPSVEAR